MKGSFPWIFLTIAALLSLLTAITSIFVELRKMRWEQQEGLETLRYQQPHMLKRLGRSARFVGLFLMLGVGAYEQAQGFPDSYFPWNAIIGVGGPGLLLLLSWILSLYANTLQKTKQT